MGAATRDGVTPEPTRDAARRLLDVNLGLAPGERFLFVSEGEKAALAAALTELCEARGADVLHVVLRAESSFEPPVEVALALRRADAALLATRRSYTHTEASSRARAGGTRLATSPGLTEAHLVAGLAADYEGIARRARRLAEALGDAPAIRVTSRGGTDLRFATTGLAGHAETGLYAVPGSIGNLPAGEASIGYAPGSARGVLVVDGSYPGLGLLPEPVAIVVEGGRAVAAEGASAPFFEALWARLGERARHLAEFGVGANGGLSLVGHSLIDEKVAGTVHVGFGNDLNFGGRNEVAYHADGTVRDARVEVDGEVLDLEA